MFGYEWRGVNICARDRICVRVSVSVCVCCLSSCVQHVNQQFVSRLQEDKERRVRDKIR